MVPPPPLPPQRQIRPETWIPIVWSTSKRPQNIQHYIRATRLLSLLNHSKGINPLQAHFFCSLTTVYWVSHSLHWDSSHLTHRGCVLVCIQFAWHLHWGWLSERPLREWRVLTHCQITTLIASIFLFELSVQKIKRQSRVQETKEYEARVC